MHRFIPFIAAVAVFIGACVAQPGEDGGGGGGGGSSGGGIQFVEFHYTVPEDGTVVDEPIVLGVDAEGLAQAAFDVDGDNHDVVTEPPFSWTFEPHKFLLGEHELAVLAKTATGLADHTVVRVHVARKEAPADILSAIQALPENTWFEIPHTRMRAVGWNKLFVLDDGTEIFGQLSAVMSNFSGGAFDTLRNRLVVWGGGQSYPGNEIYAFDLDTFAWERLNDPSPIGDGETQSTTLPDGRPAARHTYEFVEYLPPPVDRLFVGGGAGLWPTGQFSDTTTWLFDFATLTWEQAPETPEAGIGSIAAVDGQGRAWQIGQGGGRLSVFDPIAKTWTRHAQWNEWFGYVRTAEIHPVRNEFVAVGRGETVVWDLDDPDAAAVRLATKGDREIEDVASPGLAYDPVRGDLVAWGGGKDVYVLDLDAATWTKVAATGETDPGPPNTAGTFGRFRYVPALDVFVVVNTTETNVFVYRR